MKALHEFIFRKHNEKSQTRTQILGRTFWGLEADFLGVSTWLFWFWGITLDLKFGFDLMGFDVKPQI